MTTPIITRNSWFMILLLGLIWGATFMVIEIALRGISPFWLASGRIGFAAILTLAIWLIMGGRLFADRANAPWMLLILISALSTAVPFMLLSWGIQYTTSSFAGISMASVALIVLPLAHFLIPGEAMTLRRTIGFVIGFVGVLVLIGPQALALSGAEGEVAGRIACIGAAACYALSSVLMRRLPAIDPVGLSAVGLLIGALVVIPAAIAIEGPPPLPDGTTLFALAVLGLIPTAGANLLRVLLIRSAGPTFMSLTNYMVPLWAVIFGVTLLGEALAPSLFFAMALILAGLLLSQWGALRRLFGG